MFKYFLSTLLGLVVAIACVPAFGVMIRKVWPPPADITTASTDDALRAAVDSMPPAALVAVATSWVLATFLGGLLASKLSGSRLPSYLVGGFVALATVSNLLAIPYPAWFWFVALVLLPVAAWAAGLLGAPRRSHAG